MHSTNDDFQVVARQATGSGWLVTPSAFLLLLGAYLGSHAAIRLLQGATLGIDDAEQVLFAQQWAWGYRLRQPPLFTWLLLAVSPLVSSAALAVAIVRYSLLALTFGFLYLTARRWIGDQRLAMLAVASYPAIYVFGYYAHHDLTHTTALGAAVAVSFYVMARLVERPTLWRYLALGACFGLGMLSKWNFAMLAIGMPLACLILPPYRRFALNWRIIPAVILMAIIVAPTAFWVFEQGGTIGGVSSDILRQGPDLRFGNWVEGSLSLLKAVLLFPMPFLPLFLVIFKSSLSLSRGWQALAGGKAILAYLVVCVLVTLALHVILVSAAGAVAFTERWMHPALMVLPLVAFLWLDRCPVSSRQLSVYAMAMLILVAVALSARLYRIERGADHCGQCREFAPFAELAQGLRAQGFHEGTIVADGLHIGGNMRAWFPASRVIDPAFPLAHWPQIDHNKGQSGMCLAVWQEDTQNSADRRQALRTFLIDDLDVSATATRRTGRVAAMMKGSATRPYALGFDLYLESQGGCR